VGVTIKISRNVSLTAEGGRIDRKDANPAQSFVDSRALLLLGFTSGPLYTARSRR